MKRTHTIFLLALSMLLVLGHGMVPHSHVFPYNSGISHPAHQSLADLLKATFSHDLGSNHLKIFKGYTNTEFFTDGGAEALAVICNDLECCEFSTITTEIVIVSPEEHGYEPELCSGPLRAPPFYS